MGLNAFQALAENLDSISDSSPVMVNLPAGSRGEDWRELINMRLVSDQGFTHLFMRGGSEIQKTFFGNILTIKGFDARISGQVISFIAVHTSAGKAYLWETGSEDPANEIIDSGLSSTRQVRFFLNGQILYIFDAGEGVYKFHDIALDQTYDWLAHQSCNLTGQSWVSRDWQQDNIFGFRQGGRVLMQHNFENGAWQDPGTGLPSLKSFITRIDRLREDSFSYAAPGNEGFTTSDGVIGAGPATPDLSDYEGLSASVFYSENKAVGFVEVVSNGGGSTRFSVHVGEVKIPNTGVITADNADTITQVAESIETAMGGSSDLLREFDMSRSGAVITLTAKTPGRLYAGRIISIEYYDDPQDTSISTNNTRMVSFPLSNPDYIEPVLWKGYMIVDLLPDGSISLPGRPLLVSTTMRDIIENHRSGVELTFAGAPPVVQKRYVYATRWQTSPENVFTPSRPDYENSAFFFVKEVNPSQTTFRDFTDDSRLISPLSGRLPLSAGIPEIFGKNQLSPRATDFTRGTLVIGGYQITRPSPATYIDVSNPDRNNIFVDVSQGSDLAEQVEIGAIFEYTDGKKSGLHESGLLLTDGTDVVIEGFAGEKATTDFFLINEPSADSTITILYPLGETDEESVVANYLATDDRADVATKMVNAINADNDIQLTAILLDSDPELIGFRVTEKSAGSEFNGNRARVDYQQDLGLKYETLDGGVDPVTEVTESTNKVTLHSLNGLVSKIYILLKDGVDWRLAIEAGTEDPEFLGMPVRLPNSYADVQDFPVFTLPGSDEILEAVELYDHMVTGAPPQQILIREQTPIADSSGIQSVLVTRFDADKTQMRIQMLVFTDQNLQTGYYVFGSQGVEKDFEIARHGFRLLHPDGAFMVDNTPIAQTSRGIYALGQGGGLLIDSRDFPVAQNNLTGAAWRDKWGEYWLTFSTPTVLGVTPSGEIRRFDFGLGYVSTCFEHGGNMAIGHGADLFFTDINSVLADGDFDYEGIMESRSIGGPSTQTKILEVTAFGQAFTGRMEVDGQRQRKEHRAGTWTHDFIPDWSGLQKSITMAGASWTPHIRGVSPRIRIRLEPAEDGFVSGVQINHITLENRGKAR